MVSQEKIEEFRRSDVVNKAVKKYSTVNSLKQNLSLAFDWFVIFGAGFASSCYLEWILYPMAVLVIAGRQHALLVMMHEAAHYRLMQNKKINDFIGDIFAAYPLLFSTAEYRKNHLAHHKYTNSSEDPDWVRKANNPDWNYPQSKSKIAWVLLKQLLTAPRDWMLLAISVAKNDFLKRSIYWGTVFTGAFAMGLASEVLMYWVIPMFTVFPVLQRCRSMSEHFGLARAHEFNSSRNTLVNPLESAFFAPHNVNYHLLHHFYPSVPQNNLPAFHNELLRESSIYRDYAHTNHGFIFGSRSVLADLSNDIKPLSKQKAA